MAALSPQNVLEFLTARGFSIAASALRDEIVGSDGLDGSCPPLPPLRTAPNSSSSSGSSDAFVSMGSTPSELLNPYGLWSPRDKSDDPSEFGTARQCDDFNIFSQTCWYDDQRPEYLDDSYPGFLNERTNSSVSHSEDKFVMAVEEEEQLRRQDSGSSGFGELYMEVDDNHKSKHHESYLCDCCSGEASGMAESSNSLAHGYQLKQADKSSEAVPWEVNPVYDPSEEERKKLDMRLEEKDFPMTNRYTADENTLTNGRQTYGLKNGGSANCNNNASSLTNTVNLILQQDGWNIQLSEKSSQPDGIDSHELGEFRTVDRESHDFVAIGVEGEDHSTTDELQLYNSHEDDYEIFDLRIIHRKNRTGFEANKDLPIILNSVIAGRYYVTGYLGSAAFSKVVQAHDLQAGVDVCLKIIKNDKDFFDQSLDEIKLLKTVNKYDPSDECHILRLYDYFYYQEHLFIVSELLGANLYEFQRYNLDSGGKMYFTLPRIQAIALQCLEALEYLHHMSIIHCDLKPENILIKSYSRCEIKIIDLGSSCFQTDNLCLYVQSRSYRAPEVILGLPYDEKIDMWSLGCVLAELYTGDVLFPNDSVVMILARMIGILGPIDMGMLEMGPETHKYFTDDYDLYHRNVESGEVECLIPEKSSLPHCLQVSDTLFVDFLECLLQINPKQRSTASESLQHQWFSFSYQ